MKLTQNELEIVGRWEKNLRTAIRAKYLRHVGRAAIEIMIPIYERATGYRVRVNSNCGACVLDFLQRMGAVYFADLEEMEAAKNTQPEPEAPNRRTKRKKQ